MRDPNRIDPILARLRAAWIARPDLRLGQLLACSLAIGGAEDKFARLFNAECPEFGAVNAPIEWPPVDRPAPTPTPAPGLDLDAVERAERAMTPGDWFVEKKPRFGGAISVLVDGLPRQVAEANGQALVVDEDPAARQIANAAGIVALRNAAPALIAEVRAARAEIARLTAELAAAHRIIAEQRTWLGSGEAAKSQPRTDTGAIVADVLACAEAWAPEARVIGNVRADEIAAMCHELAAARAVPADVEAAIAATNYAMDRDEAADKLRAAFARAISDATAARGTVGGLLAAGEERESRAWSEKGKAPPGSCPFCASRISMVQRDGYFIARCSHRGCGAVGPRMRSVSRAADLFCQPPRRKAQGMSCGPIVASPPRPRCSCTHEAGDSRCDVHPTCSECGASTTRPVDECEACRGPLPKGG